MNAAVQAIAEHVWTAGDYLRLRREAEGLSLRDVAIIASSSPIGEDAAIEALKAAEENREPLASADIFRIAHFMPIMPGIYLALSQGLITPDLCIGCGCSWDDACADDLSGGRCAWANAERDLCTVCARKTP